MGLRQTKRPDDLMILPRIFAETGRITDHGGAATAALGWRSTASGRSVPRPRGERALT